MKHGGEGWHAFRMGMVAEAIDDFESHLGEATEKCERNRGKYERLARKLGWKLSWKTSKTNRIVSLNFI